MPSTNTADSVPAEQANASASATWLNRATTADENDQRAQPWKAHVKDTLPINVPTKEAEYIVLTLENNVQHNGKNPWVWNNFGRWMRGWKKCMDGR